MALSVDLAGPRRICPAQVGCLVDPDGSRRNPSDRLDDQPDDQARQTVRRAEACPAHKIQRLVLYPQEGPISHRMTRWGDRADPLLSLFLWLGCLAIGRAGTNSQEGDTTLVISHCPARGRLPCRICLVGLGAPGRPATPMASVGRRGERQEVRGLTPDGAARPRMGVNLGRAIVIRSLANQFLLQRTTRSCRPGSRAERFLRSAQGSPCHPGRVRGRGPTGHCGFFSLARFTIACALRTYLLSAKSRTVLSLSACYRASASALDRPNAATGASASSANWSASDWSFGGGWMPGFSTICTSHV
jgi:hypothetical protein